MPRVKTWVIGRGGLVGSAVARRPELEVFEAGATPWGTDQAGAVLLDQLEHFMAWVGDAPWGLVWAAGSGVMHTGQAELDAELAAFRTFIDRATRVLPTRRGGVYLVSSAGGTFAGSPHPPFGTQTPAMPLNAYGRSKLAQESAMEQAAKGSVPVTIGRLANVYGPGQDLTKMQGLVTQLCLCALLGRPAKVFAPLPTLRDYIYVDDTARIVAADVVRMTHSAPQPAVLRVVCSGRSTSIAELMAMVEHATGRVIPMVHVLPGEPYILDLRLTAGREHAVDRMLATPLETGITLVWQDLVQRLATGRLAALA